MSELATPLEQLHRYHDGDLRGFERWIFERRLKRSAALRGELEAIERVSTAVRAQFDEVADGPDLWAGLASQLSAIDAQVEDEAARAPRSDRRRVRPAPDEAPSWLERLGLGDLGLERVAGWQVGTAALAVAAAVALFLVQTPDGPGELAIAPPLAASNQVVRYIDSDGAPVMMIDREDVTIVWMMDAV